jgi:hypothetical protein
MWSSLSISLSEEWLNDGEGGYMEEDVEGWFQGTSFRGFNMVITTFSQTKLLSRLEPVML